MTPSTRSTTRKAAAANPAVDPLSGSFTAATTPMDSRSDASADHPFATPATADTHDNDQYAETSERDDNDVAGSVPDWAKSSIGAVRKTVDDDLGMNMDLNGLKDMIKDEEDMEFLKQALEDVTAADMGEVNTWAEQQEQAKYNNELKAHVAAVDAAPKELKDSLLARSKSGIYDSIRPKKTSTSVEEVKKTDGIHAAVDEVDPSAMEIN